MENTNVTKTVTSQDLGDTKIQKEEIQTAAIPSTTAQTSHALSKTNQIIWFFFHFVGILLLLRFIFLILGANQTGIVFFIYNLSQIFVAPFKGIFPEASSNDAYLDTATLVALAMWYLLAFLVTKMIRLFSDRKTTQ